MNTNAVPTLRSPIIGAFIAITNLVLAGLAVAMVLGYLGRLDQAFDLLSHFRLHLAIMAAVMAAVYGWTNALRRSALAAFVAILGFSGTLPHIIAADDGAAYAARSVDAAQSLKILSYNIHGGTGDHDAILAAVAKADPDILILPESWSNFRLAVVLLDALAPTFPHRTYCPVASGCSVTILSRHPLNNIRTLDPGKAWPPAVVAELELDGQTVTVFGVHLVFPLARKAQVESIKTLSNALSNIEGPTVMAGDFNATPWSHSMRDFSRAAGFRPPPGYRPSWPAGFGRAGLPIDHVIARNTLTVSEISVMNVAGSDHRPIVATIAIDSQ